MISIERNKIEGTSGIAYKFLMNKFSPIIQNEISKNGLGAIPYEFYIEFSGNSEFIAVAYNENDIKKYELTKKEIKEFLFERKEMEQWLKINKQ